MFLNAASTELVLVQLVWLFTKNSSDGSFKIQAISVEFRWALMISIKTSLSSACPTSQHYHIILSSLNISLHHNHNSAFNSFVNRQATDVWSRANGPFIKTADVFSIDRWKPSGVHAVRTPDDHESTLLQLDQSLELQEGEGYLLRR